MQHRSNETLTGERACFATIDTTFDNCHFTDGESPLKESSSIICNECVFSYKYPLWYSKEFTVNGGKMEESERAGVWYSSIFKFVQTAIDGPKNFRHCSGFTLKDIRFSNALETLWWNSDFRLDNVVVKNGAYFGMGSSNATIEGLTLEGDYAFDSSENLTIKNSTLHTKDAFWNCHNITLINCTVIGEYFGWNSSNITLINCHIESHQGFCYMKGITLKDCEVVNSDLCFEYCSGIEANILTEFESIKNPISGKICAKGVENIIRDDPKINAEDTEIILG